MFESGAIGFANTLCLLVKVWKKKKDFPNGKDFLHYFSELGYPRVLTKNREARGRICVFERWDSANAQTTRGNRMMPESVCFDEFL